MGGLWRPPQWSNPAMVTITIPATTQTTHSTPVDTGSDALVQGQSTSSATQPPTVYVFDAVLRLSHMQRLTKTRHPVQTGADISSHAYLEPASLTMYVGMSDVMDAYASGSDSTQPPYIAPFTGNPSKSVSAYLTMVNLQQARQPLTVTTRLRTYENMLITAIEPEEDSKTITGLRMRIEFEQIFTATISSTAQSARSNDTASTGLGSVDTETPDMATTNQFSTAQDEVTSQTTTLSGSASTDNLLNWLRANPQGVDTPGAGVYSSANTNNLQNLPAPD